MAFTMNPWNELELIEEPIDYTKESIFDSTTGILISIVWLIQLTCIIFHLTK